MSTRLRAKPAKRFRKMRGVGLLKALLLIPLALVLMLLLALAFYEGRKAYWDYRVREMCAKDGGTRIYETVLMPRNEAIARGLLVEDTLIVLSRSEPASIHGFFIDYESSDVRRATPRVFRARTKLVRARDMKVLGEMVVYSRVGGDFPTFANPSSMTCQDADSMLLEFRNAIQVQGEKR